MGQKLIRSPQAKISYDHKYCNLTHEPEFCLFPLSIFQMKKVLQKLCCSIVLGSVANSEIVRKPMSFSSHPILEYLSKIGNSCLQKYESLKLFNTPKHYLRQNQNIGLYR